jgi:hypothetical protein
MIRSMKWHYDDSIKEYEIYSSFIVHVKSKNALNIWVVKPKGKEHLQYLSADGKTNITTQTG